MGKVANEQMILNNAGAIVDLTWNTLSIKFPEITLGEYQIMPNHLHGIIFLSQDKNTVVTTHELSLLHNAHELSVPSNALDRRKMLLSKAIGFFKMNSAKAINIFRKSEGAKVWQRSFHDRVIRDYPECCKIELYIRNNPANWNTDPDNIPEIST